MIYIYFYGKLPNNIFRLLIQFHNVVFCDIFRDSAYFRHHWRNAWKGYMFDIQSTIDLRLYPTDQLFCDKPNFKQTEYGLNDMK